MLSITNASATEKSQTLEHLTGGIHCTTNGWMAAWTYAGP